MRNVPLDLGLDEVTIAKDQPQYRAIQGVSIVDVGSGDVGMLTRWRFEDAERDAIAAPMIARALLGFVGHLAGASSTDAPHLLNELAVFAERMGYPIDTSRGEDPADFWLEQITFGGPFTPIRLYVERTEGMRALLGITANAVAANEATNAR